LILPILSARRSEGILRALGLREASQFLSRFNMIRIERQNLSKCLLGFSLLSETAALAHHKNVWTKGVRL
jgi:hypothetical protein